MAMVTKVSINRLLEITGPGFLFPQVNLMVSYVSADAAVDKP